MYHWPKCKLVIQLLFPCIDGNDNNEMCMKYLKKNGNIIENGLSNVGQPHVLPKCNFHSCIVCQEYV
jgi:hypothetical protein